MEFYTMTQKSEYFTQSHNFFSASLGGVDPRTGLYSFSFPIINIVANGNLGPEINLSLNYNQLNTDNIGFGKGISFSLTYYDALNKILYLSNGETYRIKENPQGIEVEQRKLKTFKIERTNENYIITYKSGVVEILEGTNSGREIKNVISIHSPLGHQVNFNWIFKGINRLSSIEDQNGELININYDDLNIPALTLFSETSEERLLHCQLFNGFLKKIVYINNDYKWDISYNINGFVESIIYPSGLTETVTYQNNIMRFPEDAIPALPAVIKYILDPGNEQKAQVTTYEYTSTNYLGFASGVNFSPNRDNAYAILTDYQYGSTETQIGESENITITRHYNNFHLITEEKIQRGTCIHSVKTEYYAMIGMPFDQQPEQFQLPKQTITQYTDLSKPAEEQSREEITKTEFDIWGNPIKEQYPDGSEIQTLWYAAEGEENCPPTPNGFVKYMKQQTLIPPKTPYLTPIRVIQFSYQKLGNTEYIVQEKKCFYSDNKLLSRQFYTLNSTLDDISFGRVTIIKEEVYDLENEDNVYINTQYFSTRINNNLITQTAKLIGYDGLSSELTRVQSLFSGLLYTKTDAQGINTNYQYDCMGRIISKTLSQGTEYENTSTWHYLIDQNKNITCIETDGQGNKSKIFFDGLGRIIRKLRANSNTPTIWYEVQSYNYNLLNEISSETSSDWQLEENQSNKQYTISNAYCYDNWGQITKASSTDGRTRWQNIDVIYLTKILKQSGTQDGQEIYSGSTQTTYDINSRPLHITLKDQQENIKGTRKYDYDGWGRLCREEDELGHVTLRTYDAYDRVVTQTAADGSIVTRTYAPFLKGEQITSIKVTGNNSKRENETWTLGTQIFDSLGRVVKSISGGRVTDYTYQKASPVPDNVTTPAQEKILMTYVPELDNAILSLSSNDVKQKFSYNARNGRLLDADESNSVNTLLAWHPSGTLKTETVTSNLTGAKKSDYQWTLLGSNTAFNDITSAQTRYNRNAFGQLIEVADNALKTQINYNALGDLSTLTVSDPTTAANLKTQLFYDDFGREISRTITDNSGMKIVISQTWLENDQLANRVTQKNGTTVCTEHYDYDLRNRLLSYEAIGSELPTTPYGNLLSKQIYSYDALNNLVQVNTTHKDNTIDSAHYHYQNDKDPTQLSSITHTHANYPANISLSYDANGRMIKDEIDNTLHYDAIGRLKIISNPNGKNSTYSYDALNRLAIQNIDDTDSRALYYRGDELVNELMTSKSINNRLIKLGHHCLGAATENNLILTATDSHASLLWSRDTSQDNGTLSQWSPYGYSRSDLWLPGFNGERRDPLSGNYHLGNGYRTYNPQLMRFISPDSLSPFDAGGINPYAYCAGDPINRLDPSGHLSGNAITGIVLGALGLIFSIFTAGASIIAAGSVAAALSSTSAITLAVGALGVVSDITSIVSGAISDSNLEASSVLGWVSLGTGIAGISEAVGRGALMGLNRATSGFRARIGNILDTGLSGRGATAAAKKWAVVEDAMAFYRGENRAPNKISEAGGFKPWSQDTPAEILQRFKSEFSKNATEHSQAHVRSPNRDYISFGTDMAAGGYADSRDYLYEIKIPKMHEQNITAQVLGTETLKFRKNVASPRLLLDGETVDTSNFVAMLPARTVEATFVTPIPKEYITRFRHKGKWFDFPL